ETFNQQSLTAPASSDSGISLSFHRTSVTHNRALFSAPISVFAVIQNGPSLSHRADQGAEVGTVIVDPADRMHQRMPYQEQMVVVGIDSKTREQIDPSFRGEVNKLQTCPRREILARAPARL